MNTLKRVKKVRSVSDDGSQNSSGNEWRLALQSKFKSVQVYKPKQYQSKSIEKYRAFSNVTKVKLYDCGNKKRPTKEESRSISFLWSAMRYVPGMVNLKSLSIKVDSETHPGVLKRLDSMSKILFSLKKTKIHWVQRRDGEQKTPFSSLLDNKNLLKFLTHLALEGVVEDDFSNTFELLSISCKGLINISLKYLEEDMSLDFLRSLENFPELKRIQIFSANVPSFFENLRFPPSAKNIHINLKGSCWEGSLKIWIERAPREISTILTFVNLILKSIPSLVNFGLLVKVEEEEDAHFSENQEADSIDLMNIFRALQKFSDKLQETWLLLHCLCSLDWSSRKDGTFPKLTQLILPLSIISDIVTIQNFFSVLKGSSIEAVNILLCQYVVDSNQALLELLQVLRTPPSNLNVELVIEIKALDFSTFDEIFGSFIEKGKKTPAVRNVSLSIGIADTYYDKGVEALDFLKKLFGHVTFSRTPERKDSEDDDDAESDEDESEEEYSNEENERSSQGSDEAEFEDLEE